MGAIETIYYYEDRVVFQWDDMEFSAALSGDISDSWSDILGLMRNLKSEQKEFNMQFLSQTFWHYWEFKEVEQDFWEIEAFWSSDKKKKIKVAKVIFQKELQKLIDMVEADLVQQKYILDEFHEYTGREV